MNPVHVTTISALSDNYIYLIEANGRAAAIDPAESDSVIEELSMRALGLEFILNTHHHFDHVSGNMELKRRTGAMIIGPDDDRIPGLDRKVGGGDTLDFNGVHIRVIETPGHGKNDISFHIPAMNDDSSLLFCGDTLFVCGCGRLLEGTAEEMWDSLNKVKGLPDDTLVYCGHEYTEENIRFALSVYPDDEHLLDRLSHARERLGRGEPTVPSRIGLEKQTNPFLRAANIREFAELRRKKDVF